MRKNETTDEKIRYIRPDVMALETTSGVFSALKNPPGFAAATGLFSDLMKLLLSGSADGAGIRASAAIDALLGIDFVLAVAFGNRFNGAAGSAGAAGDAGIGDRISHDGNLLVF